MTRLWVIHYLNANGGYSLGSSFSMNLPFAKYLKFRSNTQVNNSQSITYVDALKVDNRTLSWSQNLAVELNKRKMNATANVNYYSIISRYIGTSVLENQLSTWDSSSSIRWSMLPSLVISADCNYRINSGYPIPIKNPVLLNAYMELFLTKRKEVSLQLQGMICWINNNRSMYCLAPIP